MVVKAWGCDSVLIQRAMVPAANRRPGIIVNGCMTFVVIFPLLGISIIACNPKLKTLKNPGETAIG
jgi:hypothetical protein